MNIKELRNLYAKKLDKFDEIKADAEIDELRDLDNELKELKERIAIAEEDRSLVTVEERQVVVKDDSKEIRDLNFEELDKEYEKTFLRAFRGQQLSQRDHDVYNRVLEVRDAPTATPYFQSAVGENGGYIVPHSVSTQIQRYKRELEFELTSIVRVQKTSVLSGEFTFEKLGSIEPWPNISQWETIPEVAIPQFERKEYKIEDYAGILPIPRTLLQDTDQNLLNYISEYIARKTVVTRNAEILKVIKATYTQKIAIKSTDDFKDIVDLNLDPAFRGSTTIVTNKYGYNYLRKLKDAQGNYLLQPDVTQPDRKLLDGKVVHVINDNTLPNPTKTKAPVYVGDFAEGIRFFDRGVYEITPTTVGGDSFKRNSYDIRVIDRFDVVAMDPEAVVYGEIDLSTTPAPSTAS